MNVLIISTAYITNRLQHYLQLLPHVLYLDEHKEVHEEAKEREVKSLVSHPAIHRD